MGKTDMPPVVLYGDTSQDTRDAMAMLRDTGSPFQLSLYHDCQHIPALHTMAGVTRGLPAIRRLLGGEGPEPGGAS